jgi:hypothetical protein
MKKMASSSSSKAPIIVNHGISENSMREELSTMKDILAMQQKDYQKMQDHVLMLEAETGSMQKIIDDKQIRINKLQSVIDGKSDNIKALETLAEDRTIDKKAFDELDNINRLLRTRVEEKEHLIMELEVELRMGKESRDDTVLYNEARVLKNAELDVIFTSKLRVLTKELTIANKSVSENDAKVALLQERNHILLERLRVSEDQR